MGVDVTVIAWDGKTLAADRQATSAECRREVRKIFRLKNGEIASFCGAEAGARELLSWYEDGADPAKYPPLQATNDWVRLILVTRKGVFWYEQRPVKHALLEKFFAWGSGRDYALGAMAAGASAKQAVAITCRYSVDCGMGIDTASPR